MTKSRITGVVVTGIAWLAVAYALNRTGSLQIAGLKWGSASDTDIFASDLLQTLAAAILFPGHIVQWLGGPGWLTLVAAVAGCFVWGWLTVKAASCLTNRRTGP
jgi:hypothetical protein